MCMYVYIQYYEYVFIHSFTHNQPSKTNPTQYNTTTHTYALAYSIIHLFVLSYSFPPPLDFSSRCNANAAGVLANFASAVLLLLMLMLLLLLLLQLYAIGFGLPIFSFCLT